ncbi:MAG TPA: PEP-CTERM sorting domain-containing protein [Gammaproteobacteria bacterium]|nr:PEP-CTERM sorting domain-containing protein [Gammaproteobacteria bacterium]
MLHRTLGVAFAFYLGAAHVGAAHAEATLDAGSQAVPEPSTLALFALGVALVGIAFIRRRTERQRAPKD